MTQIKAQTLKGFRDFLPKEAKKRQYVIQALKEVFELYGFEPLETPALEYDEILSGKYGEEGDKLMYRFEDRGGRKVAMRYDQTVPLARVVAQYGSTSSPLGLPMPFKRYQIQPVWRAENTQKGRYREFLQCDIDTVGSSSPLADAEIITCVLKSTKELGLKNIMLFVNDRKNFEGILPKYISTIDKLEKIGRDNVLKELEEKGLSLQDARDLLRNIENKEITNDVNQIFSYLQSMISQEITIEYKPTLARGLDYYTGAIFELITTGTNGLSIGGGGRYDKLIGMFSGKDVPAVGFSFGFDRLIEAMEELKLFPDDLISTKVLVTIFNRDFLDKSVEICSLLRSKNINTELFLDENATLEKQLKYADKKEIPYVVILGPEETTKGEAVVKNMKTGEQKEIKQGEIAEWFNS